MSAPSRAAAGTIIPSGASTPLVVRLDRRRRLHVHDGTNVRPIDAHAEGVRGDDDREPARRSDPRRALRSALIPAW